MPSAVCPLPALTAPGGSVVDPSLLRLAADRGVTICFADLDGADGLWVPEERTVLVNRSLSEREVAAVIEHELGHVAIDDQHAELDAGVGRPPPVPSRRWAPAALTAAACLAVVGGVSLGLARDQGSALREEPVVAPTAPPRTAGPPVPGQVITTTVMGPDGEVQVRTITLTATPSATTPPATTAGPIVPSATGSPTEAAPPVPSPSTVTPTAVETTSASPTVEATTPSVEPTTESPAAGGEDGGDDGEELDTASGASTRTGSGSGSVLPPGLP